MHRDGIALIILNQLILHHPIHRRPCGTAMEEQSKQEEDEMGRLSLGQLRRRDIGLAACFAAAGMHFDAYLKSPHLQQLYARYFFLDKLKRATQVIAAYDEDELAGVLLSDIEGESKRSLALPDRLYCGFAHAVQHVFFRGAEDAYDEANREMLADFRKQHEDIAGEICFLVADPFHKRKDTGSFLLSELERREEGKHVFLYTDSNCTWQFYEHRGFRRVGTRDIQMDATGTNEVPLGCYLYAKVLGGEHL